MKYERLTKKFENGYVMADCTNCPSCNKCDDITHYCQTTIKERLAELEAKIEQGTLIELPCKVDSEIYIVDYLIDDEEKKHYYIRKSTFHPKWINEWRNMFALTREEAEAKLKELQE